ncbi:SCO4848 family membrane protein [Microbacterium sediminis]|uniref:Uncharacterized protein n=1 Tax=Microbacterium sediminis TaxID=904291 RepID=A0A1B9NFF8_9MICO|nr:hypothetical protein [Microbacterium sediminis]OCG75329.1 hypothetical protein A7J15_02735 [Microbacterium sediminis]QBR74350.1 hypothetical protein E3O41_07980 [Microbacterium sediminis]
MENFLALLLLVNAAFNVIVWPRFWKRVSDDPRARDESGRPTRFLTVHAILIGLALLLALGSALAGGAVLIGWR